MTRTNYKPLDQLSITEIETMFAGYDSLVEALEAQTHSWRKPAVQPAGKRQRGFARLFTFKPKVAKRT